jgi:protein-disulfide isomerase
MRLKTKTQMSINTTAWTLAAALVAVPYSFAQDPAPVAPPPAARAAADAGVPATPLPQADATPSSTAPPQPTFPPVDLKNFTADSPSKTEVDSFLHALWGFDPNRVWQVAAILKTPAPGVSRVVVFVADKNRPGKAAQTIFFTTPDGKHAIADTVIPFGAKPWEDTRKILQAQANGPARGAAGKDLLLVEFADLQCAHCKEIQDAMNRLVQDFPQARIVFQPFPLPDIHPFALRAAAEGLCVRKAKGDAAFFTYAEAIYDKNGDLTPTGAAGALAAAATAAGADPAKTAACADTQEVKDEVSASFKLGTQIGVDQSPMLSINGHIIPVAGIQYDTLKRIVAFQGREDGLDIKEQPTLSTLK